MSTLGAFSGSWIYVCTYAADLVGDGGYRPGHGGGRDGEEEGCGQTHVSGGSRRSSNEIYI